MKLILRLVGITPMITAHFHFSQCVNLIISAHDISIAYMNVYLRVLRIIKLNVIIFLLYECKFLQSVIRGV